MIRALIICSLGALLVAACSSEGDRTSAAKLSQGSSGNGSSGATFAGGTASNTSSIGGSSTTGDIGTWTDAPGVCPSGMTKIEVSTVSDLAAAARGEGSHQSDPASVCYFIRNGTYDYGSGVALYVTVGGTDATHRRVFVGESRSGVVIRGRGNVESGVSHLQLSNFTFNLTGYAQSGSFNTLEFGTGSTDFRIDHITFTGDCLTGSTGGHIEFNGPSDVIVEACLIEKFGRCGPNGHLDHGVYLASGSNITIRNNEIRGNASRGIQIYTQGGEYGTLNGITIELNRIHDNGHADYEDGMVLDAADTGTVSNVVIQRNLIYSNYYSGIRMVDTAFKSVVIRNNTFYQNGVASTGSGRSELNIDDTGSGANTSVTRNIIVAANRVLNNCYDAQPRSYLLTDNLVQGPVPTGTAGNCISGSINADPMFVNATERDFHTQNSAANAYGAYSP